MAGVQSVAQRRNAEPAQIALAWVLAQAAIHNIGIVPIPGTKRRTYLDENLAAADIALSAADLADLNQLAQLSTGTRYPPAHAKYVET